MPMPGATEASTVALRHRLLAILAVVALNTTLYLLINAHPTRTPMLLPTTALDEAIGWHAWTIWPYWLLLCINPFLALGLRTKAMLWTAFRAYALAMGLNMVVWLAWPTRIVRPALPDEVVGATRRAWEILFALDEPNTCFPSGHITIPVVVMIAFAVQHPASRRWIWLPALLFPTILTTGQHYAIDMLGGAATALVGAWWSGLLRMQGMSLAGRTATDPPSA